MNPYSSIPNNPALGQAQSRRDFLWRSGGGLGGIALAGIMGGLNSEIAAGTEDVLIECAYFQPQNIRATAKRLGISTDASYRFERGCDPNCCDWVSQRAAQLIIETAGGRLAKGCA